MAFPFVLAGTGGSPVLAAARSERARALEFLMEGRVMLTPKAACDVVMSFPGVLRCVPRASPLIRPATLAFASRRVPSARGLVPRRGTRKAALAH